MKKNAFLLLFLLLEFMLNAQTTPPVILWQKSFGGTGDDEGYTMCRTNDGGSVIAGISNLTSGDVTGNHGDYDFWVIRIDTSGNLLWQKSLGGTGDDEANSVLQSYDKGFIILGSSNSIDGDVTGNIGSRDYWVVKLDSAGNLLWQKSYGGTNIDATGFIQPTKDSGYVISGYTYSNNVNVSGNHSTTTADLWSLKIDSVGNIVWQKCLGGTGNEWGAIIHQTNDGGYIVAGDSKSNNGDVSGHHGSLSTQDYWVVKLDTARNIQWQKSLGGTSDDVLNSIEQTNDGGYIIAGSSMSNNGDVTNNHGNNDYWIVKLDTSGNIQWQKCLGGTGDDQAMEIHQTSDGGYIVTGESASANGNVTANNGGYDFWIVKLDTVGNIQWQKSIGGTGTDVSSSIYQNADGSIIVAGYSDSNDGDVSGNHGSNDFWVAKLVFPTIIESQKLYSYISIFPNPSSGHFSVKLPKTTSCVQILNSLGEIIDKKIVTHQNELNYDIINNGIYYVQIFTEKEIISKKIIIDN